MPSSNVRSTRAPSKFLLSSMSRTNIVASFRSCELVGINDRLSRFGDSLHDASILALSDGNRAALHFRLVRFPRVFGKLQNLVARRLHFGERIGAGLDGRLERCLTASVAFGVVPAHVVDR